MGNNGTMATGGSRRNWRRLAEFVRSRRDELDISQREAAYSAGVSDTTWSHIEGGTRTGYSSRTLRGVCRALGWTPTSTARVLAGGEPELLSEVSDANGPHMGSEGWPAWLEAKFVRLERRVDRLEDVADRLESLLPPGDEPPPRGGR